MPDDALRRTQNAQHTKCILCCCHSLPPAAAGSPLAASTACSWNSTAQPPLTLQRHSNAHVASERQPSSSTACCTVYLALPAAARQSPSFRRTTYILHSRLACTLSSPKPVVIPPPSQHFQSPVLTPTGLVYSRRAMLHSPRQSAMPEPSPPSAHQPSLNPHLHISIPMKPRCASVGRPLQRPCAETLRRGTAVGKTRQPRGICAAELWVACALRLVGTSAAELHAAR
jgi:hypothetical protein